MITLYIPTLEDLWFRQKFLSDSETMSYNHTWGGTIDFPEEKFVGEAAYHHDEKRDIFIADIIVPAQYRGQGFGKAGLTLLCNAAKNNGIDTLYDNIAIDNPAIDLFLKNGFREEYRTNEIIMLKKELRG